MPGQMTIDSVVFLDFLTIRSISCIVFEDGNLIWIDHQKLVVMIIRFILYQYIILLPLHELSKLDKRFDFLSLLSHLSLLLLMNSALNCVGNKPSATVQPFLLLHLDILPDGVHTIEDALHIFSASETLEGYRGSAGKVARFFSMKLFVFVF